MSKAKEETTEVAESKKQLPVATSMMDAIAEDSGQGFEGVTSQDVAVPYYGILQSLSPQVARGPKQIKGASDGDIFNNMSQEVIKGDEGIRVIPCYFQRCYVEWTPRESGGGFVQQHDDDGIMANTTKDDKGNNVLPNGNFVVETAYHYVIRVKENGGMERAIMSMSSTQMKSSRRWVAQQMSLQIRVNGKMVNPPPYSHIYDVKTRLNTKDNFVWSGWDIDNPSMLEDIEVYQAAKQFAHDICDNVIKVAPPEGEEADGGVKKEKTIDTEAF